MTKPMHRRLRGPLKLAALTIAASLTSAAAAEASQLADAFSARPYETRIILQQRLAKADLFLGTIDGKWDRATERALRRGADQISLTSGGEIHPDLRRPSGLETYLINLESGAFDKMLAPRKRGWFSAD